MDEGWTSFLGNSWSELSHRARLVAPPWLVHPRDAGFTRPWIAEPAGQVADWTLSLADGSRVHAHEHADGTILVHRDAIDPGRGPVAAARHFLVETAIGHLVFTAAVGALVGVGLGRLSLGFPRSAIGGMLPP